MHSSLVVSILLSIAAMGVRADMSIWCDSHGTFKSNDTAQVRAFNLTATFFQDPLHMSETPGWFGPITVGDGTVFMGGSNYDDPNSCWNALKDHARDQVLAGTQYATCNAQVVGTIARCWLGYTYPNPS